MYKVYTVLHLKKRTVKPFKPLKSFYKTLFEKNNLTPRTTARNSLPQEIGTSSNALTSPPFCGDKIFTEKR